MMEKYTIPDDVKVFGVQVKTFPYGIGESFQGLVKMLPSGDDRPFYGISECTTEGIMYKAAALETYEGEAEKYHCEKYIVEKGDYLSIRVKDWLKKTDFIKVVFDELFKDGRSDRAKPCVEIYENDDEMLCLVKVHDWVKMQGEVIAVTDELMQLLSSFDQEQLNTSPFEGSWTAAQVADHLIKSNATVSESLSLNGIPAKRKTDERVEELQKVFLDFTTRLQAPAFILPGQGTYGKDSLLEDLGNSIGQLKQVSEKVNLSEIVEHPAFGQITKLEILHFVIYHTQRHIHQLKNVHKLLNTDADYRHNIAAL